MLRRDSHYILIQTNTRKFMIISCRPKHSREITETFFCDTPLTDVEKLQLLVEFTKPLQKWLL